MTTQKTERAEKMKKLHMVLCGAGVGTMASRGIELVTGGYSLPVQLICIVAGLVLAHFAVKKFYKAKAISPADASPGLLHG